jgi:hypothetical protein
MPLKPLTPENLGYMRHFNTFTTLAKFFGRASGEERVREHVRVR